MVCRDEVLFLSFSGKHFDKMLNWEKVIAFFVLSLFFEELIWKWHSPYYRKWNLCISKCSIYIEQPRKIKTSFFFHGRNEKLWNCISVYIFIQIKESEIPLPEVKMHWWVTEINRAWNRSRGMKPFTAVSWLIHYSRLILPVHINGLALTIFISEIVFRVKKNNVVYDRFNCSHQLYTILLLSNCRLDTCF